MARRTALAFPALVLTVLLVRREVEAQDTISIPNTSCVYRPSTRIEPSVLSKVEKDVAGTFRFEYRVRNGTGGFQNIWTFKIEILGGATSLQAPGEWNGSFFKYKPIGGWAEVSENRDMVVRPGQEISGFRLDSTALPSIVSCWTQGENPQDELAGLSCAEEEEDSPELDKYADFFFDSVKGKTLGPVAPPPIKTLEDAGKFLDSLRSTKHQAADLGWIKPAGVVNSLDKKLDNAQAAANRGDWKAALNIGQAFLNELEGASCKDFSCPGNKPISSEGYALLRYNMEFLLAEVKKLLGR